MTTREKYLMAAGAAVGIAVVVLLLGASRLIWPAGTAARAEETASPAYESAAGPPSPQHEAHELGADSTSNASEPLSSLQLSDEEQRSIGLQTPVIERRPIRRELVAAARVEEPETQLANISARIGGRIDKLRVDFTG